MASVNEPDQIHAQRDSATGLRAAITVGAVRYGTGDDANCDTGVGLSGGVDVRSRGRWFLGGRADVLFATPFVCTQKLPTAEYNGQSLEVWSGSSLVAAPRVGLQVGRDLTASRSVEVSALAGYMLVNADFFPEHVRMLRLWYAVALSVQPEGVPVALGFDIGRYASPTRYQNGSTVVHEFNRWKPVYSFTVTF